MTMSRPKKNHAMVRLNLELPVETRRKLDDLKEQTRADSVGEVVRRATSVYEYLLEARRSGQKIVVSGPDGDKEIVLL